MTPPIGLHPDVPAGTYFSWNAASASRLKTFARSPAHMREAIDNPKEPTPALIVGNAGHTMILEPDAFGSRFVVADQCSAKKLGDGSRCSNPGKWMVDGEWRCGVHAKAGEIPGTLLSQDDYDACRRMADAVRSHRSARDLLDGRRHTELSALWNCPETKVLCKLRADALTTMNGHPVIADLKTTEDASREAFEKSIWNFRYYRQAAHYTSGLAALDQVYDHFVIIAVEKEPPHAVAVYRMLDDVMDAGREEVLSLLRRYGECVESGVWPAYPQEVQDIGVPAWGMKQLERVA